MKFRYRKSLRMSYARQGYIYFNSHAYPTLTKHQQEAIQTACRKAGGDMWQAILERMTTHNSAASICMKHNISEDTLDRLFKEYCKAFPKRL